MAALAQADRAQGPAGGAKLPLAHHAARALTALQTWPVTAARTVLPSGEANPDFPADPAALAAAQREMAANPVPLARPVVLLSGYRSWPVIVQHLRLRLTELTSRRPEDFLSISYTLHADLDRCVRTALDRVEARFPSPHADRSVEIDVIGVSMGGLVSRRASRARTDGRRRLDARRVFTLGSPHRGAVLAEKIAPDPAAKAMRPGSGLLGELDATEPDAPYELTCYAVQNDAWVGATRTSPPGLAPYWTTGARVASHFTVSEHPAIVTDLARRLRGEPPIAARPSPPPRD